MEDNYNKTIDTLYDEIIPKYDILLTNISNLAPYESILTKCREKIKSLIKQISTFKFDSSQEFVNDPYHEIYYVIASNNEMLIKLFFLYAFIYNFEVINYDFDPSIGLDFEFNGLENSLIQISFYNDTREQYIFIVDQTLFSEYQKELFIRTVFMSDVKRITHGADALDIPFVIKYINDKSKAMQFIRTVIDTRFLCEFSKFQVDYPDKKCSIYDALLFFKCITEEKYKEFTSINEILGPVQDVKWNIKNLSSYHLKYTAYDVLYLRFFLRSIHKFLEGIDPSVAIQIEYINQINRLWIFEKYEIINVIKETKALIDPTHNYIVHLPNSKKTMIEVYNNVIKDVEPDNISIHKFLEIMHFKSTLTFLFKRIVYSVLTKGFSVYKNKNTLFEEPITFKEIYPILSDLDLGLIISMCEKIYQECKILVNTL